MRICAEATRAGAASLDAYPADPDAFSPESYSDRGLERAATAASAEAFSRMVQPGLTAAAECGNMYAGVLFRIPGPHERRCVLPIQCRPSSAL